MALQVKTPSPNVPEAAFEAGTRAIVEKSASGDYYLYKLPLGSAAVLTAGAAEGNVPVLEAGGALPAALLAGTEPIHSLVVWATATRDLALTDGNKHLHATHATPLLTIKAQADVAYPANYWLVATGTSALTITAASGVTINGVSAGSVTVPAETAGGGVILRRRDVDTWVASVMDGTQAAGGSSSWPIKVVTGASYTVVAGDAQTILLYAGAGPFEFDISSDLGANFQAVLHNMGDGQPTIDVSGGQTVAKHDGTAPLRMRPGASSVAVLRTGANAWSLTGLYRVGATFTPATAEDHWTAAVGLVLPTTESLEAAEAEQTGSDAISLSSGSITINAAKCFKASLSVGVSSVQFATINNMTARERRVRIVNTGGGACSVTASGSFDTANFGAGVSIPAGKHAAFIIEDGSPVMITFAGYGD